MEICEILGEVSQILGQSVRKTWRAPLAVIGRIRVEILG